MLQSILTTLFDILGTTIWVICAVIARIAQCLMKWGPIIHLNRLEPDHREMVRLFVFPNIITMESITLYFREGSSDKVYSASIDPKDGGHVVNFAYGRRGSTLNTGTLA